MSETEVLAMLVRVLNAKRVWQACPEDGRIVRLDGGGAVEFSKENVVALINGLRVE
jgi:hypothetical protein